MMAVQAHSSATSASMAIMFFMAWRNIWRNPIRSILTISALVGGLIMMILYSALLEGMMRQMVRHATEISTGHIQVHRQAFIDDRDLYSTLPWDYLRHLEQQQPALRFAPRLYAAGLASTDQTSTGVMIRAIDPQREQQVTAMLLHIRQGRAELGISDTTESGLTRYNLVVGTKLARHMGLSPGSELILVTQAADGSIGNALFRVAGVLKPIDPGFDRSGILMSISAYQQLMYLDNGFHELVVQLPDSNQLISAQTDVEQALQALQTSQPLDRLGGQVNVRNWRQLTPTVSDMLELSQSMVLIIGLIIIGLACMGILNTMLMAIHERRHEFGILLAIGMKRRLLLIMVLFDSLMLALLSAVFGALAASLLIHYLLQDGIDFSHWMPDGYDWAGMVFEPVMEVYLEPMHIATASSLMVIVALVTALIPCLSIIRLRPAEVIS